MKNFGWAKNDISNLNMCLVEFKGINAEKYKNVRTNKLTYVVYVANV